MAPINVVVPGFNGAALFAGTTKNPLNQLICSINMRVSRFGAEKYKPITSLNKPEQA
jgi:hypothetical protein